MKRRVFSFLRVEGSRRPKEVISINMEELDRVIENSEELKNRDRGCPMCLSGGTIMFRVDLPKLSKELEALQGVASTARFCPNCGKQLYKGRVT